MAPLPQVCFTYPYGMTPDESQTGEGIISFADDLARQMCVKLWDTDGDSQMSYAEAAAVKDIDWTFNNSDITTLDELAYFTGISIVYGESFINNPNLTSVTIPRNVTTVGFHPFRACPKLKTILVDEGNVAYCSDGGVLYDRNKTTLERCPQAITGTYSLHRTTQYVSYGAFQGSNLTSVELPASVIYIDEDAFSSCSKLTSIKVHWQTPLETDAPVFASTRTARATLYVPSGTAAAYTASPTWGVFGSIVEYDDVVSDAIAFIDPEVEAVCLEHFDTDGDGLLTQREAAAVTSLGGRRTVNRNITRFPELELFTGLTAIGDSEFEDCALLSGVTIAPNVTRIGRNAFAGCRMMGTVTIPAKVSDIATGAFDGMSSLRGITVKSGNRNYSSVSGALYNFALTTIIKYPAASISAYYSAPTSLRRVDVGAFRDATNLTLVSLPAALTHISRHAFHGCRSLQRLPITSSLQFVGDYAFAGCESAAGAALPSSIRNLSNGVFAGCTALADFSSGSDLVSVGANAFAATPIMSLPVVAATTTVGDYAFARCGGLVRACLPEGVKTVGSGAFLGCSGVAMARVPSSVSSIGDMAYHCSTEGVGSMRRVLANVPVPPVITEGCFDNQENCVLLVPEGSEDLYAEAPVWRDFASIKPLLTGDVDLDGEVSLTDVMVLVDCILNAYDIERNAYYCPMQTDVNADGSISISDVMSVVNLILGLSSLPQ